MELIRCHIINFGRLHDYTINFDPQKNIICDDNGSGKSTLAAFIRIMFYGFEGEKVRNPIDRERARYNPWQGGVYGGHIVFETAGRTYTLSRTFGSKAKDDTFELRDTDTNLLRNDFSSNIGRELFSIDSASFLRSAFITQKDCVTFATDDINSKISNLSDDTNDLNNYEAVNSTLDGLLNKLTPKRKTGLLFSLEEEINTLTTAVMNGRQIEETIDHVQKLRDQEQLGMDQARKERAENVELQSRVAATANRKHWDALCRDYEQKESIRNQAKEIFPAGIPSESGISTAISDYRTAEKIARDMEAFRLTGEDIIHMKHYSTMFRTGFKQEEYNRFKNRLNNLISLRQNLAGRQLSMDEKARLEDLKQQFKEETVPVSGVNHRLQLWRERCSKQDTLLMREASLASMKLSSSPLPETKRLLPLLISGIILILIGMILFVIKPAAGLPVILLGAALGIAGELPRNDDNAARKNAQTTASLQSLENAIFKDRQLIAAADQELQSYLKKFGLPYAEAETEQSLQKILNQALEYEHLSEKEKKAADHAEVDYASSESSAIREYLLRYGIDAGEAEFSDGLIRLRDDARLYGDLRRKNNDFKENELLYQKIHTKVTSFLKEYGLPVDAVSFESLTKIRDDIIFWREAEAAFQETSDKKTDFEMHNDIKKIIQLVDVETLPALSEIDARIHTLDKQIDDYDNKIDEYDVQINALMEEYDDWVENQKKLESKTEQYNFLKKKYELLSKTKEYIQTAKEGLVAKYSGSIEQNFKKYIRMITNDGTDPYYLDANANITKEEYGHQRDTKLLSAGYQDLLGFCLRIAFVDAMFQEEKPFLILDDPFVNLDQKKTECGMKLIDRISSDYQIVYFTCHRSRT